MGIPRFLPFIIDNFPSCLMQKQPDKKLRFDFLLLECDSFSHRARHSVRTIQNSENYMFKMILRSFTECNISTGAFFLTDGAESLAKKTKTLPIRFRRKLDRMYCFMDQLYNGVDSDSLDIGHLISATGNNTVAYDRAFRSAMNRVLQVILSWGKIGAIADGALEAEHKMEKIISYCRTMNSSSKILITTPDSDVVMIMLGLNVQNVFVNVVQKHRSAMINIDQLRWDINRAYLDWRNIIVMHGLLENDYCVAMIEHTVWQDAMKYTKENGIRLMKRDGTIDSNAVRRVLNEFAFVNQVEAEVEPEDENVENAPCLATDDDIAIASRYWQIFCITVGSYIYGAPSTLQQPTIAEQLTPFQRKLIIDQLAVADLTLPQPLFSNIQAELDENAKHYTRTSRILLYPLNLWQHMLPEHVYLAIIDALEANDLTHILTSRTPTKTQVSAWMEEHNRIIDHNATIENYKDKIRLGYPEYGWFLPDEEEIRELINVIEPVLQAQDGPGSNIFESSILRTNLVAKPFMQVFTASRSHCRNAFENFIKNDPNMKLTKNSSFTNRDEEVQYSRFTYNFASADEIH
ncbi:hypothetical protein PCE1_000921 [Barthelona sp. PCE]